MSTIKTDEQTNADIQAVDEMFAAFGRNGGSSIKAEKPKSLVAPQIPVQIETKQTVRPIEQPKLRTRFEQDDDDSGNTWVTWSCRAVIVGSCALIAYILLTGYAWSPLRNHSVAQPIRALLPPSTHQIGEIEVGMRVAGTNPDRSQVKVAPEPNAETSQKLVLRMKKESGRNLFITLLRPLKWIEASDIKKGSTFHLELPEMGAVGDAYVEAVLPCPPIKQGKGNVVTGTFAHEADPDKKILRVEFSDGAVIKGVTDNHPFWSVDRNAFVPVGEMKEGEWVKAISGVIQITKITARNAHAGEMLYNLETHNEHVYQVTVSGVLVHNSCWDDFLDGTKNLYGSQADAATAFHNLRTSGYAQYKGSYSKVGHSFTKHAGAQRAGSSAFPKLAGNDAAKEATARSIFEAILTDPAKTITNRSHSKYGQVVEIMGSNGQGAKFDALGNFLYFFE